MAIALITAGGTGRRTGNSVPKQFLTVDDIPIIVYTMKNVQDSGCYDSMYVICADGWKDFVTSYAEQYHIDTFKGTITGGASRFESLMNGLRSLMCYYPEAVTVSLVDANRPLTPKFVFEETMCALENADAAIPLEPCFDSMYITHEKNTVEKSTDRSILFKGQTPETARLGLNYELHCMAEKEGINTMTPTALMLHYNKKVAYTIGTSTNFKITTADDLMLFKAMVQNYKENRAYIR